MQAATAALGVSPHTGLAWWRQSGRMELKMVMGFRGGLAGGAPASCPGRGRHRRALSSEDRAVIAAGLAGELSYARIAASINRDTSVISREVARNRGADGSYLGAVAHRVAHEKRRRPKELKLLANPGLCRRIEDWMDQGWSPGLIAQMRKVEHGANMMGRVRPRDDLPGALRADPGPAPR